jgi:UDP-N-acetylmuramoylalanine--D-glutamate ligase
MSEYKAFFNGKKVTLMGLGLLGRGIGDTRFLASLGAELIVTDLKTEADLANSLAELKSFTNITYHLGGHDLVDFRDRDLIIKAAGVPLDSPVYCRSKEEQYPCSHEFRFVCRALWLTSCRYYWYPG